MGGDEHWQISKNCFQERFTQLLRLSRWTDCTFRVGHHEVEIIRGHKLVLAVSSPVFEALFYGSLSNPDENIISVPDIEPHTFKTLLQYLYSDEVVVNDIEEAGDLLYAAKKYLVIPLTRLCVSYLIQHTWIKNLWEVLIVAEGFNEDKLLAACLKIMSRYQYEIWCSENDNMSVNTLRKLLEQEEMNMTEVELWNMVMDWCRKELDVRNIKDTPEARRALIDDARLLPLFRFLTMRQTDLDQLLPVITEHEVKSLKTQVDMPESFSKDISVRHRVPPLVWRTSRDLINNKSHLWINRGEVICNICTTSRVLIIGFEVFTRLAQITPFIRSPSNCSYREKLVVFIKDSDGNVLQKTDYDSIVLFNSSQSINLERPIWFEENVTYTVNIGFISGQYPICNYTNGSSRGTNFYFDEVMLLDSEPNKIPNTFIISVLYAL